MNVKRIKPMYTHVVTTMDMYIEDQQIAGSSGIIDVTKLKQGIKEYQTVLEVGTTVRNLEPGMIVCINPARYAVRQFSKDSVKADLMDNQIVRYNFNVVKLDGKDCLLLDESDIEFIVLEYDE